MNSKVREPSELQIINGIGDKTEQELQAAGIQNVPDLLSIPAQEIVDLLQARDCQISLTNIEKWQMQAKEINPIENTTPSTKEHEQTETNTIAVFMIEFRSSSKEHGNKIETLAQHFEGGKKGGGLNDKWDGLAYKELINWIKDQINDKYLNTKNEQVSEKSKPILSQKSTVKSKKNFPKTSSKPILVSISKLQAYQPPGSHTLVGYGRSGEVFTDTIKGNQPCELVVDLEFPPLQHPNPESSKINCEIQTYITNRETGKVIHPKRIKDLINIDRELKKSTKLPIITLRPGLYRIQTILTVKSSNSRISFLEIPLLEVV